MARPLTGSVAMRSNTGFAAASNAAAGLGPGQHDPARPSAHHAAATPCLSDAPRWPVAHGLGRLAHRCLLVLDESCPNATRVRREHLELGEERHIRR